MSTVEIVSVYCIAKVFLSEMLQITPRCSKFDTAVRITVEGLKPRQPLTICSLVQNGPDTFGCFAQYFATDKGDLDLTKQMSVGGNFTGLFPMGLFSFLKPLPGQRKGLRLMPKTVLKPIIYRLSVFNGHLESPWETEKLADPVITAECERFLLSETVSRREIKVGRLRGVLFTPKSKFLSFSDPGQL